MSIQTRAEQREQDTWDLTSLFADEAAWEAATEKLKQRITEAPSLKGSLAKGKESFLTTMQWYEETSILLERIYNWAFWMMHPMPLILPMSNDIVLLPVS